MLCQEGFQGRKFGFAQRKPCYSVSRVNRSEYDLLRGLGQRAGLLALNFSVSLAAHLFGQGLSFRIGIFRGLLGAAMGNLVHKLFRIASGQTD